jgi:hypothetical protein
VTEELLVSGAPITAHWIADRQSGPLILRVGTEAQKLRFLPAIARGEIFFCIGMSEPDSGSDLVSIRTRGTKVEAAGASPAQGLTSNAHLRLRHHAGPHRRRSRPPFRPVAVHPRPEGAGVSIRRSATSPATTTSTRWCWTTSSADDMLVGQPGTAGSR